MAKDVGGEAAFPFPSAELLERGLSELGFPEADGFVDVETAACDDSARGNRAARRVAVRGRSSLVPLFNRYIRELELFNAVFDLVGAESGTERGRSDLVVRHILDSLAPWKRIASLVSDRMIAERPLASDLMISGSSQAGVGEDSVGANGANGANYDEPRDGARAVELADAGSGAGFPGLPLAIAFPLVRVTLIERMSKRCAFLENCVAMLRLSNVTVLNCEVENAPAGKFDIVVFRAFRPLDAEMARTLLRLTVPAGKGRARGALAAWKAKREKIDAEMDAIAGVIPEWDAHSTPVPFLGHEERHLVVIS